MKMILKLIGLLVLIPLIYVIAVIALGQLTYYSPKQVELLSETDNPTNISDSTFTALIWNIGYGGLGEDMDFFFDDGKRVRPTPEMHKTYFSGVKEYLGNSSADFILLQEVDQRSKRSYKTNELEQVKELLTSHKHSDFAYNYKVKHVPLKLTNPLGHVKSGLLSLSKETPMNSSRYQFPGSYGFPNRLFFLRRCFVQQTFSIGDNGRKLVIINTHNSAYDDGSLKAEEMIFLKNHLLKLYSRGDYVLVGGDWNQLPPSFEGENVIPKDYLPDWEWAYDPNTATNRSLEKPYDGTNKQKIIDFYLVSPNLTVTSVKTDDLKFKYSDHQPVSISFQLK